MRPGYTTGACAAAAAKGAALVLLGAENPADVEIPLPMGGRARFRLKSLERISGGKAKASVIKDAGDDPDVTNKAEIAAMAERIKGAPGGEVIIEGGSGVGIVTRPGLAVPVGEPAINPVPRRMIREAVGEAFKDKGKKSFPVRITILVPGGQRLAGKTLNERLGIVGGISILGTTGIVIPLSGEAWKATIRASMDVARAMGLEDVVLSAGRASELGHMRRHNLMLPEPAYVLMGDYVSFGLLEAKSHGFKRVHLAAQWAKMLKIAMNTPDTHVRAGAIDTKKAADFLRSLGARLPRRPYNTARQMLDFMTPKGLEKVCQKAKAYGEAVSGIPLHVALVSYEGDIIAESR